MDWTTAGDIRQQVLRHWNAGRLLRARMENQSLFPLELRFRRPDGKTLLERFDEARKWIRDLEAESKAGQGFGYEIQWVEINHRRLGHNRVPSGILVPTEPDALRLIGKSHQTERFARLAMDTLERFPALRDWLVRKPLTALEYADDWPRMVAVLSWFVAHPRSGLYLRQLDIPGVDTKFIESRTGLLSELLDIVLFAEAVDSDLPQVRVKSFEQRYGLISKPPLIRFRLLDERLNIQGLSDLSVPLAQFARLHVPVERVFITENEINGLSFSNIPQSLVIFGLGYGVQLLAEIDWLKEKQLFYWGDIDTHGFAILDRLRAFFPDLRSLLMERETLMAHRELWGEESERYDGIVNRLTESERALFEDLRNDSIGNRVRLEQERVSFSWFQQALRRLMEF
jgi:hypothetical protein